MRRKLYPSRQALGELARFLSLPALFGGLGFGIAQTSAQFRELVDERTPLNISHIGLRCRWRFQRRIGRRRVGGESRIGSGHDGRINDITRINIGIGHFSLQECA